MEDIAVQLFKLGDLERKGFIIKRDMQRLQNEVSLQPDQLEAVFDSLDSSHSGYLTLDQFIIAVNNHGYATKHSKNENDLPIQKLLNLNVLHRSGELMCEVRELLESEDTWHQLLAALFADLNQLLRQISQLEETLQSHDQHHQNELQKVYEELEVQLSEDRDRLQKQLYQREMKLRSELAVELKAKEQQISELLDQRDQLKNDLHSLMGRKLSKCISQEDYHVDRSETLHNLYKVGKRHILMKAECSYMLGYKHAQQHASIEEEGLVKQLNLLKEMQDNLKAGTKAKHLHYNFDDIE